jgi:hypothetical protein
MSEPNVLCPKSTTIASCYERLHRDQISLLLSSIPQEKCHKNVKLDHDCLLPHPFPLLVH